MDRRTAAFSTLVALELVLTLIQTQAAKVPAPKVWILTASIPDHAVSWGLTRSADGSVLYVTDSTDRLLHVNATTLEVVKASQGAAMALVERYWRLQWWR